MKLYAGRTVDHADLVKLWPHTGFTDAIDAADFYRNAYPAAPDDPYLTDYITDIANRPNTTRKQR